MSRLKNRNKLKKGRIHFSLIIFFALITGAMGGFIFWSLSDLPKIKILEEYSPSESSLVYSKDNELLAEFYFERRTFIPYFHIPEHVKDAFIAVEDTRFYEHHGIDFVRIIGALIQDIKAGAFVQGGSTITQQLAKMLFLKPERSITRKIKEAALSLQIERHYTKDEILGLYLNQTYFGTRAYGIKAASQTYFGKSPQNISIDEAALLAALPKAPSIYSPFKNPKKAKRRRNFVLKRMLQNAFIKEDQYREAIAEPLPTTVQRRKYKAPYFIEYIRNALEQKYGERLYTSGLRIHATLDYRMQQVAERAIEKGIEGLRKRGVKEVQAALLAIDLKTGEIKAMVGGTDFWETQFNRSTQAKRQPGSAFKPIVYLTALSQGLIPDDIIIDKEVTYVGENEDDLWTPQNYEKLYHGEVTLRTALSHSLNAATVCLADTVGIRNVVKAAKKLGITSQIHPFLPSALGASDLTLKEMVFAYATLSHGKRLAPIYFDKIIDRDELTLEESAYLQQRVVDEGIVEEIRDMLRSVILEGTGNKAKVLKKIVYGKTGTTDNYTDAWFIGFDKTIALGVWVGRDDHKPIGNRETGARAALPIWIEFMKNI